MLTFARWLIVSCAIVLGFAGAGVASACSWGIDPNRDLPSYKMASARWAVKNAFAIIDAEVVRASSYDYDSPPALLYAHRVLKGPDQRWFEVGSNGNDSCANIFTQVGERQRVLLFAGPLGLWENMLSVDQRYVDRILGSDRRRDFPYFAGPRP